MLARFHCEIADFVDLVLALLAQKPDNVGFDVRGDVKIFDFGLAKELDESKKLDDGTYHLTSDTGSLRYMAPGKCKPRAGVQKLAQLPSHVLFFFSSYRSLLGQAI